MMPTRPLQDLSTVVRHTVSSNTQCSVIDRILIQWCRASHLHQVGPFLQQRPTDELPKSPSRTCSCRAAGSVVGDSLDGVPHELILSGQQLLNADSCMWWRWRWIGMRGLPMSTLIACRSLGDVKHGILGGSGSHHLSQLAYIIRHGNSLVEFDASYVEVNTT
jgi:hypothetical protein